MVARRFLAHAHWDLFCACARSGSAGSSCVVRRVLLSGAHINFTRAFFYSLNLITFQKGFGFYCTRIHIHMRAHINLLETIRRKDITECTKYITYLRIILICRLVYHLYLTRRCSMSFVIDSFFVKT